MPKNPLEWVQNDSSKFVGQTFAMRLVVKFMEKYEKSQLFQVIGILFAHVLIKSNKKFVTLRRILK